MYIRIYRLLDNDQNLSVDKKRQEQEKMELAYGKKQRKEGRSLKDAPRKFLCKNST